VATAEQHSAAHLLRRRQLAHLLVLAAAHDPGSDWEGMVVWACRFGARMPQPPAPEEYAALAGMTLAQLYDRGRLSPFALMDQALGPAVRPA
jgi:hypothetical protein